MYKANSFKNNNKLPVAGMQPSYIDSKLTCRTPYKGTTDLRGGWGTPSVSGMDVLT